MKKTLVVLLSAILLAAAAASAYFYMIGPKTHKDFMEIGEVYFENGDYRKAESMFNKAVLTGPGSAEAYIMRGASLMYQDKTAEAIEDLDRAIKIQPEKAAAYFYRARAKMKSEDTSPAIKDFSRAILLEPDKDITYINRALCYASLNDMERALADIDYALELSPDSSDIMDTKAKLLLQAGDTDNALKTIKQAIKAGSKAKGLHITAAKIYEEKMTSASSQDPAVKNAALALKEYNEELKIDDASVVSWVGKGGMLMIIGKFKESIIAFDMAISLDKDIAKPWGMKAIAFYNLKKYVDALICIDEAIKLDPEEQGGYSMRDDILEKLGWTDTENTSFNGFKDAKAMMKKMWFGMRPREDSLIDEAPLDPGTIKAHEYKDTELDALAKKTGVKYLLEGSMAPGKYIYSKNIKKDDLYTSRNTETIKGKEVPMNYVFSIDISIPQVKGLADSSTQEDINLKLNDRYMKELNASVEYFINDCGINKGSVRDYNKPGEKKLNLTSMNNYTFTYKYIPAFMGGRYLSLGIELYEYTGGAHGMEYYWTFNYDIRNKKVIKLADLFKPGSKYLKAISRYVKWDLGKPDKGTWDIERTAAPEEENFANFTIEKDGLVIYYDPYIVNCGAAGMISVKIPYIYLKGILREDIGLKEKK